MAVIGQIVECPRCGSMVQIVPPDGWQPRYHDYLYLSFTNATAFSPTDTLPVQAWAKMAMLAESVLSLITAIMVIARAINGLPGSPLT